MTSPDARKLNLFVGAAIKALAASGADDETIGEFAATYRAQVARILGQEAAPAQSPDLLDLIKDAVASALRESGRSPARIRTQRINVEIAGKRTTVTLRRDVLDRLSATKGPKPARALINSLVDTAPTDLENRSAWVEERVLAVLALEESARAGSDQPRH